MQPWACEFTECDKVFVGQWEYVEWFGCKMAASITWVRMATLSPAGISERHILNVLRGEELCTYVWLR
jgi:hypothetical protein